MQISFAVNLPNAFLFTGGVRDLLRYNLELEDGFNFLLEDGTSYLLLEF